MSAPNATHQWLWQHLVLLDGRTGDYHLLLWDNDNARYAEIGNQTGSLLVLPGDPPIFVTVNGDVIGVRGA